MNILKINVNCGNTTCASESGVLCEFVSTRHFGTQFVCSLFPTTDCLFTELKNVDGWLQRCQDCLDHEED